MRPSAGKEGNKGLISRARTPCSMHTPQQALAPAQRQQQSPLMRQKQRRIRRVLRGEIQGMAAEGKKRGKALKQKPFHLHKIAALKLKML